MTLRNSIFIAALAFAACTGDASVGDGVQGAIVPAANGLTVTQGGQATVDLSFVSTSPDELWSLAAAGLPAGVSGSFAPATVKSGDHATLTVTATGSAVLGSAPFTITAQRTVAGGDASVDDQLTVVPSGAGGGNGAGGGTGGGSTGGGSTGGGTGGGSTGGGSGGGSTGGGSGGGATGGGSGGGTPVWTGSVGPTGGTVSLLHFLVAGDTRPPNCGDIANYPSAIINGIADQATARNAQFGLDLGDHMYVCNSSLQDAASQMALYTQAVSRFSHIWFMTMGNHECEHSPCPLTSTDANYVAFTNALRPISHKPYYSFNITTSQGLATFVIIADNGWDATQQAWLDATLTTADANARYTIIARHHPEGDTSVATNPASMAVIRAHKFSLFLTGHTHDYHHMTTDNGRDAVIGNGGAPLVSTGTFNGYAMVDQLANGNLNITVWNLSGNTQMDQWTVPPNQ